MIDAKEGHQSRHERIISKNLKILDHFYAGDVKGVVCRYEVLRLVRVNTPTTIACKILSAFGILNQDFHMIKVFAFSRAATALFSYTILGVEPIFDPMELWFSVHERDNQAKDIARVSMISQPVKSSGMEWRLKIQKFKPAVVGYGFSLPYRGPGL